MLRVTNDSVSSSQPKQKYAISATFFKADPWASNEETHPITTTADIASVN